MCEIVLLTHWVEIPEGRNIGCTTCGMSADAMLVVEDDEGVFCEVIVTTCFWHREERIGIYER
jgi:hypothetical protein